MATPQKVYILLLSRYLLPYHGGGLIFMRKVSKKGMTGLGVNMLVSIGIGVIVLIMLFVIGGVITGQVYQSAEADIDAITNTSVSTSIKSGIIKTFTTYETTASYSKIVVIAILGIGLIALLVGTLGGVGQGGNSAL